MTKPLPTRQTRFTNVADAHAVFFGDDLPVTVDASHRVVDITKNSTIVESRLMLNVDGEIEIYRARGEAKRLKGDPYDANVGIRLATARALENLSNKLARQAEGLMSHNEGMAADSQRRKDANRARSEAGIARAQAAEEVEDDDDILDQIGETVHAAVTNAVDNGRLGQIFRRG